MSWGGTDYGSSAWGGGAGADASAITISALQLLSEKSVKVTLSAAPLAASAAGVGDALNPLTWSVTRDDGTIYTVTSVTKLSATVFRLRTIESWIGQATVYTVATVGLKTTSGDVVTDDSATVFGTSTSDRLDPALASGGISDLANPATPFNPVGGTMTIDSTGDYASVSGSELVRKLILRRLSVNRGAFFHLPDYGLGLKVKEPLPSSDLVATKTEVERQILREPEVVRATASVSLSRTGVLVVLFRAKLRATGEEIESSLTLSPTGGGL